VYLLICTELLNEKAGAVSQVSEIRCPIEAAVISTLNLVLYPACFGTSVEMQQTQKIHVYIAGKGILYFTALIGSSAYS
jgi:hypothetical protein